MRRASSRTMALLAVPGGPNKNRFSRPARQMPSKSMISSLPTKVFFRGRRANSTSFGPRCEMPDILTLAKVVNANDPLRLRHQPQSRSSDELGVQTGLLFDACFHIG